MHQGGFCCSGSGCGGDVAVWEEEIRKPFTTNGGRKKGGGGGGGRGFQST